MMPPAAPPTAAPMIAPRIVFPAAWPITPPTTAPPITAPRVVLFQDAQLTEAIKKTVPTATIRIFFIIIVFSFVSGLSSVMVLSLPRLSLPEACSVKTGWAWEMYHC